MNETEAHILVYTLGPFSVERRQPDGTYQSVSLITSGPVTYESHTKSLLGYLLCCPARETFRPTIVDELWGEKSDRVSIDEYMYRATSNVSRVLGGEPYFRRTHKKQRYILADQSQIWNDADHCQALIEEALRVGPTTSEGIAHLQEAQYYFSRGTFLVEETGAWVYPRRSKMETLTSDCLNWLLDAYEARQEYKLLEETAEQLLRTDPFNGNALYRLMIALDKRWMGHEALRRYRETTGLAKKAGRVLSSDVQTLAQQLGQKRQHRPVHSSLRSELVAPPPLLDASPQGIIPTELNALKLNAKNLRDSYLTLSTDRVPFLKAYSSLCQGQFTICRQQRDIHAQIEQWRTMNDEHIIDPSQITRRDLFALAIVTPSLLTNIQHGWLSTSVIEEFLSEVTTSMTLCWYLFRGGGLTLIESVVPQYLPELVQVVKSSSRYRQRASYLVAQGFLLLSSVSYHRSRLIEYVQHRQKATMYARESGDLTLLVTCLEYLGNAFYQTGQIDESLRTYLEAERESQLTRIPGFLHSRVRSGLSLPYAQQGQSEEVTRFIDGAYATFTEPDNETPIFLRVTHGRCITIVDEGRSILDLGNHAKEHEKADDALKYWKLAAEKLGKIEQLFSGGVVPAGIAAEMELGRALAYALEGNMEGFLTSFEKGVRQAKVLGSEKRKQEARDALKIAIGRWSREQRVTGLWELLV